MKWLYYNTRDNFKIIYVENVIISEENNKNKKNSNSDYEDDISSENNDYCHKYSNENKEIRKNNFLRLWFIFR